MTKLCNMFGDEQCYTTNKKNDARDICVQI